VLCATIPTERATPYGTPTIHPRHFISEPLAAHKPAWSTGSSPHTLNKAKVFAYFFKKKRFLPLCLNSCHKPPNHPGAKIKMLHLRLTALVTLLSLLLYFWMSLQVARARAKSGIKAPAMTGDPILERAVRVHYNTLEWLPIYLPSLWLFALYWNELIAAAVGVVWIVGRLLYSTAYMADPAKRGTGFLIQTLACAVLLLGALGKIIYSLATGHA
jgi:uncharacterized membrane protein YecN with MAPEG domain